MKHYGGISRVLPRVEILKTLVDIFREHERKKLSCRSFSYNCLGRNQEREIDKKLMNFVMHEETSGRTVLHRAAKAGD
jgi:hypothetical protein